VLGITNVRVIEGPLNGLEMLEVFKECIQIVDPIYGNPVLANGDVVVMDNCGFHHRHFTELSYKEF
jgi:hypothetical protein